MPNFVGKITKDGVDIKDGTIVPILSMVGSKLGTAVLHTTEDGIFVEGTFDETEIGAEARAAVISGLLKKVMFGVTLANEHPSFADFGISSEGLWPSLTGALTKKKKKGKKKGKK